MIPVQLRLRNFMSYRDGVAPVDFEGFHLACLSGNNGHGKSALLDAITWSLWGKARARSEDDLIHHGCAEMEVEFEFDLNGNRYRVLRKRQLRRAGSALRGVPVLEFQVRGENGYRALTGDSVNETQRKISETLGLDYDTFVNSSLVLQGRADLFTTKTPAERKKVLAELLNLGLYDRLEEKARARLREHEEQVGKLKAAIGEIERELDRRPTHEADLAAATAEVERLESDVRVKDAEQRAAAAELAQLEAKAAELRERQAEADEKRAEVEHLQARMEAHDRAIAEAQKIVDRRETILAAVSRRTALEARNDALTRLLGEQSKLKEQIAEHERELARVRSELEQCRAKLEGELKPLKPRVDQIQRLSRDVERLERELAATADLPAERDRLLAKIEGIRQQLLAQEELRRQLKQDMVKLRERLDRLNEAGATCPICATTLTDEHRQRVAAQYTADGEQMREDYHASRRQSKEMEQALAAAEATCQQLGEELHRRSGAERELATLRDRLNQAQADRDRLTEVEARLRDVQAQLERDDFAPRARAKLAEAQAALSALGYDPGEHRHVRQGLEVARQAAAEKEKLDRAEERLRVEREALERAREDHGRLLVRLTRLERDIETLGEAVAGLPTVRARAHQLNEELRDLLEQQNRQRDKQARAQQMIEYCEQKAKEAAAKRAELTETNARLRDYRDLAHAFGKNGIQAMIIETAIPQIEEEANDLLARLTDNRMTVKFETQRSAKSTDGVIETLDIKIADELGTRDYALFSGGEAFRINLAIRIALSKLLCRRVGASLQTLIIDEGFGTQDATGRERLVDAINRIATDFEKIIVITHIDELKDLFPTRIEVLKTAEGSQIWVN